MCAYEPVGDAQGYPDDSLVAVLPVAHVHSLAHEVHDPCLVLVYDGEGLPFAVVAVFICEVGHDLDGLPGCPGPLEGDVDHRAVVHCSVLVHEVFAASPGGFADGDLVLVHVPYGLEGVVHLRDLAEVAVGVPVIDLEHGAGLPVCGRAEVEFAVEHMRIRSI